MGLDNDFDLPAIFSLKGRVAVVTGGAGLLGVQFCQVLAQAGARVVLADLDGKRAQQLVRDLEAAVTVDGGPAITAIEVDVTSPESVQQMVDQTLEFFGRLDILVNSAALDPKFDPQHLQTNENVSPQRFSFQFCLGELRKLSA